MYDEQTASLIRSAPRVGDLEPTRLPEVLTECYARICSVRLHLARGPEVGVSDLADTLDVLRQLASLLEIHAAVTADRASRASAAFVSATAHVLLCRARAMMTREGDRADGHGDRLTRSSIPGPLSAGLLFLAAGYPPDARESVEELVPAEDARSPVLDDMIDLCRGKPWEVVQRDPFAPPEREGGDAGAELALWGGIDRGVRRVCEGLVGRSQLRESLADARRLLGRILSLSVLELPPEAPAAHSIYAGPHHAAVLLLAAIGDMDQRALVEVPTPNGPAGDRWRRFLQQRARTRPFLWTNHREAVEQGLLDNGTSGIVTFPTGAGKSTLAELKIGANVAQGRKVLYLAPTRSLVHQVSEAVRRLSREVGFEESQIEVELSGHEENPLERLVSVMTPERCLVLMTLFPESFQDLGLVVFDECHTLHMPPGGTSRRPVDGMLSLLRLLELAEEADVLLMSAMVSNAPDLGDWLQSTFDRRTITFDAAWKPTRQARGSVVFDDQDIQSLLAKIPTGNDRIRQRLLKARPMAVIGLQQTWKPKWAASDYIVVRLGDEECSFQGKKNPARVNVKTTECATSIAIRAARQGLKTIVFFHRADSALRALKLTRGDQSTDTASLTDEEQALVRAAEEELGGREHVVLPSALAGAHYGLLLPQERSIVEGAFKRPNGIRILFSTNTLAQGMNLPADLVIIVRTGRFNADLEQYERIEIHELLNAAGRAGRAGHSSNGLVLVIPDYPIRVSGSGGPMDGGLDHLYTILGQDDRCLDLTDPIEVLLDQLKTEAGAEDKLLDYLILRLPPRSEEEPDAAVWQHFLRRSFAYRRAEVRGRLSTFEGQMSDALRRRADLLESATQTTEELVSATGFAPTVIKDIQTGVDRLAENNANPSPSDWVRWCLRFLKDHEALRSELTTLDSFRFESLQHAQDCVEMWMSGKPYRDIELRLGTPPDRLGYLERARRFCDGFVGELAHVLLRIALIAPGAEAADTSKVGESARIASLLVRDGFATPETWALYFLKRGEGWTRVRAHRESSYWLRTVGRSQGAESVRDLLSRVRRAIRRQVP